VEPVWLCNSRVGRNRKHHLTYTVVSYRCGPLRM
jgi:hypothetical protein